MIEYYNMNEGKLKSRIYLFLILILLILLFLIIFNNIKIKPTGYAVLGDDCREWSDCYFSYKFNDNEKVNLEGEKKRTCNFNGAEITEIVICSPRKSANLEKVGNLFNAYDSLGNLVSKTELINEPKKVKIECSNFDEDGNCIVILQKSPELFLVVNSPNLDYYSSRKVLLDINTIEKIDEIASIINGVNKNLCVNCDNFNKILKFREGKNQIEIKAINNGNILEQKIISFFVDSVKPIIRWTNPRENSYTNGDFSIKYDEQNLNEIKLLIDNLITDFQGCLSGNAQVCSKKVDLIDYNNKEINYSFSIEDIAGNLAEINIKNVRVDTINPVIDNIDFSVRGSRVYFTIVINENNFHRVQYYENGKLETLCTKLNEGICKPVVKFSSGEHNLEIRVIDKAGNSDKENISLSI